MTTCYVLSNYPISRAYKAELLRLIGSFDTLTVSEMRQGSIATLIRRLLSLRGERLFAVFEDDTSRVLEPLLCILASLTRVHRLHVVDEKFNVCSLSRFKSFGFGLSLFLESGLAWLATRGSRRGATLLLRSVPLQSRLGASRTVAYLNCNLWFGVKAGGSVGHVSGVVNALSDVGYDLEFFSAGGRLLVDERAEYIALAPPRTLAMPFETTYYRFDQSCERQIGARFEENRPAFIYQRMSIGNYTGVRLSRRFGIPLVLEYNGSEAWIATNWGRPLRYHQAAVAAEDVCLRHADVVVTVSEVLGSELRDRGVEPKRIVVYPNCIDPKLFDPDRFSRAQTNALRDSLRFDQADVVATFVGTFGQWHGVDVLAQAIRQMVEHDREFLDRYRLRFVLVGDGLKMPAVREVLAGAEDGPYVRLTGLVPQHEAPMYLAASDILLSPHVKNPDGTAFFGSPTKLFEYLAMGKAIVASDLDQIGEILRPAIGAATKEPVGVREDAVAVLTSPGNVSELVEGIKLLAAQSELRSTLGRSARRLALSRYTWRHHVAAILSGLERVAGPAE